MQYIQFFGYKSHLKNTDYSHYNSESLDFVNYAMAIEISIAIGLFIYCAIRKLTK